MFTIKGKNITVNADAAKCEFTFRLTCGASWTMSARPYVEMNDGSVCYLDEAEVSASERQTGTWHGIGADYTFKNGLILHTLVYIENTRDDIWFVNRMEGDAKGQVKFVSFPSPVDFNGTEAGHGYTILPRMQGTLVPAGSPITIGTGMMYTREAYMPIFGQVRDNSGYLAVFATSHDAMYSLDGENVKPLFIPSLGTMSYPRKMLYRFMENCDYNDFAHSYREYLEERGEIVTLAEKCTRNPAAERLIGVPVIYSDMIAVHIHPDSYYYNKENPEANDSHISFRETAENLKELKRRGLNHGYIHLDGWGNHGYDNLHPDPLPPNEAAGGTEGMKYLSDTARELGYIFGIHDQYRDYYYDAPSFDFANAVENMDGSHPYESTWYGGPQTLLCAELAENYVRRNYDEFERSGIVIEGAYLDVFSIAEMDQCFNPDHPMTRSECAAARGRCFDLLTSRGIIPSSEELVSCMVKYLLLCHHSPYFTAPLGAENGSAVGIPLPLFNLVFHDCAVIPWFGRKGSKGGWGIPGNDCAWLHAVLNGNPVCCPVYADEKLIAEVEEACGYARKLAKQQIIRHEFLDETYRRQRTIWSDGTVVEVDFDENTYSVR